MAAVGVAMAVAFHPAEAAPGRSAATGTSTETWIVPAAAPDRRTGHVTAFLEAFSVDGSATSLAGPGTRTWSMRSADSYVLSQTPDGQIPHWDYCRPIKYVINPAGMLPKIRTAIEPALAAVSAASGLTFQYAGETSVIPGVSTWYEAFPVDDQHLVIAAASPRQVPGLRGSVAGLGGSASYTDPLSGREPRYFAGGVVIDNKQRLPGGFRPLGAGVLLMHELGHTAGLAHVQDRTQIMYPTMLPGGPTQYQPGDLAGLARLASFGCF